jgi:uncharacterized lipoprotein YddW (UPF0748 family)
MKTLARVMAAVVMAGVVASCAHRERKSASVGVGVGVEVVMLEVVNEKMPEVRAEFRGVWVASVDNINWPSRPGLSEGEAKAELEGLLDRAVGTGFNAVLLQVRPSADALYRSELEPWSAYLTGEQGKDPGWDPLEFAVGAAHGRGLELHAWVNPFRVKAKGREFARGRGNLADRQPTWVRSYGKVEWMDPGEPAARAHTLAVVEDIVRRYDIDGVHIDDYFYPYAERGADGKDVEFPDDATFAAHGGGMSRGDWRRANINGFVKEMYGRVKASKPWVKVGISPFGIWRPGHPEQIRGMDAYERIYADSRLWLREGWADYFSPQLYWAIDRREQSFPVLLQWWAGENVKGRHLWPGIYTTRADDSSRRSTREWNVEEIEYQIRTTRGIAGATGTVHFSASFLHTAPPTTRKIERPVAEHLRGTVYSDAAAIPASPWLAGTAKLAEIAELSARRGIDGRLTLSWKLSEGEARWVVVQGQSKSGWQQWVVSGGTNTADVGESEVVVLRAVDRTGRLGPARAFK